MNKIVFLIVFVLSMSFIPNKMHARQKGEMTLGVAGGYASYNNSGYADIYFQYSFAKHVRIAPEIGYIFKNEGKSGFKASIDMHFPFRLAKGLSIYPLAGITFDNWNYASDDDNKTRFGFDVGGGLDLYLTSFLKLTLQGKYSIVKDTDGAYVGLGIGYVF